MLGLWESGWGVVAYVSEEQKSQVKTNVMLVVFGSGKMEAV